MVDLLTAILNIYNYNNFNLNNYSKTSSNRINQVGDSLEYYIKDAFSNSFNLFSRTTSIMASFISLSENGDSIPNMTAELSKRSTCSCRRKIEDPFSLEL